MSIRQTNRKIVRKTSPLALTDEAGVEAVHDAISVGVSDDAGVGRVHESVA